MVRVTPRPLLRCAYCHEGLNDGTSCVACHAVFHADCRAELGRCPTLGCKGGALAPVGFAPQVAAPAPERVGKLLDGLRTDAAVSTWLVFFLGVGIGLLVLFLSTVPPAHNAWKPSRDDPPARVVAAFFVAGGAFAAVLVNAWVTGHVCGVARLLAATRPRNVGVAVVVVKAPVKGGTIDVFRAKVREIGKQSPFASVELGTTVPQWLRVSDCELPMFAFGGRRGEPLVLWLGENLLAFRAGSVREER
jgi:hypothetical protein